MIQPPPSIYLSPGSSNNNNNSDEIESNLKLVKNELNQIQLINKNENKLTTNTPIINFNIKKCEDEVEEDKNKEDNEFNNKEEKDENLKKKKKKEKSYSKFIGIIIVFLIAFFNTTFLELSQVLVANRYNSTFAFTWFNTTFLIFAILIEFILLKIELNKEYKESLIINLDSISNNDINNNQHHYEIIDNFDELAKTTTTKRKPIDTLLERYKSKFKVETKIDLVTGKTITTGITFKRLFITTIPISILFLMLNWSWMLGLSMTEVSISTALYQSATVFCFIFSIIILKEKIKILKSLSVLIYVIGIVLIGLFAANSTESYPNAVKGDIITIVSAILWALYEVLTNKYIGNANRTIVHTYMAFLAIIDFIFGIPIIIIFHYSKFESFQLPDANLFGMLFLNGLIGLIINYLIVYGLSVTSPLFVRSGEILSIPATLFFDIIVKHMKLPLLAIPGFILIIVGFIVSLVNEAREIKENEKLKKQHQQIELEKLEQIKKQQLNDEKLQEQQP